MKKQLIYTSLLIMLLGCTQSINNVNNNNNNTLIVFHNNQGPMCLEFIEWVEQYPNLMVKEYLTTNEVNKRLMEEKIKEFNNSEGLSNNFNYLPIIFYKERAFSGFNEEVKNELKNMIN